MAEIRYNSRLHLIAVLTACATFPLIFMGGLVTSHGAGMAVPDWPNSYGYNMFTFPPSKWIGGIFYEHTHRLMGTAVGMLSIAVVAIAWKAGWPVLIDPWAIILACGFAGFIGISFGLYPAHRAARLDPIVALRFE